MALYRIEKIEGGYRVHFKEGTDFPFSITDVQEDRAIERADAIALQIRQEEREFCKSIRYAPTHAVRTAPKD